ncbi:MAG: copper resistance protein NlpE N-terminal domain-containing protein [Deltaproteobacteria bacterium]|jgi:copper homeostasis protein (lipoprotein)|nr:copper resistance protein NlpE N-terminal domain-containing protein [Deltaproteobacteria bacterium]
MKLLAFVISLLLLVGVSYVIFDQEDPKTGLVIRLVGTFKGTLPCADCSGIETILKLDLDETYHLTESYLDRDFVNTNSGIWEISEDLTTLELVNSQIRYFIVDHNTLELLDLEGNRINSTLNYRLTK